jgi:hypothetical protein
MLMDALELSFFHRQSLYLPTSSPLRTSWTVSITEIVVEHVADQTSVNHERIDGMKIN